LIDSEGSLQKAIAPENSYTPRIPNTSKNKKIMRITLMRAGIASNNELTTVLIPSLLLTTLNGLKALRALNPRMKEISRESNDSKIQVRTEKVVPVIFQICLWTDAEPVDNDL
jgi:hypothetical protein